MALGGREPAAQTDRADARQVPIIAMTADAFAEDVRNCLDAGMDDHVAKPVSPERMLGVLGRHLADRAE